MTPPTAGIETMHMIRKGQIDCHALKGMASPLIDSIPWHPHGRRLRRRPMT
jgi:hypothetical protein